MVGESTHEGLLKGPTLLAYSGTGSCSLYLWLAAAAEAIELHANTTSSSLLIEPHQLTAGSGRGPSSRPRLWPATSPRPSELPKTQSY